MCHGWFALVWLLWLTGCDFPIMTSVLTGCELPCYDFCGWQGDLPWYDFSWLTRCILPRCDFCGWLGEWLLWLTGCHLPMSFLGVFCSDIISVVDWMCFAQIQLLLLTGCDLSRYDFCGWPGVFCPDTTFLVDWVWFAQTWLLVDWMCFAQIWLLWLTGCVLPRSQGLLEREPKLACA